MTLRQAGSVMKPLSTTDIQASRNVGMKAIWKRNSQFQSATEADAEIDDLSELIDIISKFNNS